VLLGLGSRVGGFHHVFIIQKNLMTSHHSKESHHSVFVLKSRGIAWKPPIVTFQGNKGKNSLFGSLNAFEQKSRHGH
jgi:hypothetical protein